MQNMLTKRFALFVALVVMAGCASRIYAQGDVTYAPLYLSISGEGEISPFQNGQLLVVGQNYEMTATPDAGYAFSSWQEINVTTSTSLEVDYGATPPATNSIVSTDRSPVQIYYRQPLLNFILQPLTVVSADDTETVTINIGWQANFVPVPEPSYFALIILSFIAIYLFRRKSMV
jgi:hypothetical protein